MMNRMTVHTETRIQSITHLEIDESGVLQEIEEETEIVYLIIETESLDAWAAAERMGFTNSQLSEVGILLDDNNIPLWEGLLGNYSNKEA